jgi:hypothetical protein
VFFFVLCTLRCQFLCVFLRLVYPMLSVYLCFSSSCVPYVASFSVFFFVLCTLRCQFLCVFLRLVYPMLPVSLCFSSSCVSYVVSFSVFFFVLCSLCCQFLCVFLKHRETGNIEYTRRRKTQRNWQHRLHKTKKNTEKLTT